MSVFETNPKENRPWEVSTQKAKLEGIDYEKYHIVDRFGRFIAEVGVKEEAEYIVRICNAYREASETVNYKEKFLELLNRNRGFYVESSHSSGYDFCELVSVDVTGDNIVISREHETMTLTYENIRQVFPKFALRKSLAVDNNFITWSNFEDAVDGRRLWNI